MLEEHRKKKALKHVNETIETLQTEPNQMSTQEYIQNMKEKMTPRGMAQMSFSPYTYISNQPSYRDQNEYLPDYTGPPTHKRVFSGEIKDMRNSQPDSPGISNRNNYGTERLLVLHSARNLGNDEYFQQPLNHGPQSTKNIERAKLPIEDRLLIQEMER